ncbi:MAG: hypothetical protein ABI835_02210, partial [Chloroflexota bacterium]
MKSRYALAIILAIQLVLGAVYAFAVPLWQGHEQDYYNVVRFLDRNGRLPAASDYPNGDAEIRQATQPPLFFLLAYPVVALLDDDQPIPPGAQPGMICVADNGANAPVASYPLTQAYLPPVSGAVAGGYGVRLLNVLIGMAGVVFTYAAGRKLFADKPSLALIAAALLAFEGSLVRLNSTISNDTLLITLSAANLLVCALLARRFQWKLMALLLVCVGLALITRLGGWVLLAFDIPFILLLGVMQWRSSGKRRARTMLLGVGVLLLLAAAVLVFNQITYGSLLGRYSSLADSILYSVRTFNIPLATALSVVGSLTYSSYQEPMQALQPRAIFTTIYGLLMLVALVGIVWGVIRATRIERRAFAILIAVVLVAAALVFFRNALIATNDNTTLYNSGVLFAPLRYYAAGLPAAALLISAGLMALLPKRFPARRLNLSGAAVAGVWLFVSALGGVAAQRLQPVSPLIAPDAFAALTDVTRLNQPQPQDAPQVVGYKTSEHPQEGLVDLTLYLTTDHALTLNHVAQVRLTTGDANQDSQLSPCEFLPAHGAYPTMLWKPGEIIEAKAVIPICAESDDATLELALNWLGAAQDGQIVTEGESPPLALTTLSASFQKAPSCPEILGVVSADGSDGYQIVK